MTTQTVRVDLPEEVYRRFEGMAALMRQPLEEVIYQSIRGNLPPTLDEMPPAQRGLVAELQALSDEALWAVAREPLPAAQWKRQHGLLRRAEVGALTGPEREELAALREATDRFVIQRSVALALLKWRGYTIPVAP